MEHRYTVVFGGVFADGFAGRDDGFGFMFVRLHGFGKAKKNILDKIIVHYDFGFWDEYWHRESEYDNGTSYLKYREWVAIRGGGEG